MCCMFSRVRLREQAHRCVYARVCVYCHDAAWVINDPFVCEVFLSPSHVDAVRADTFCALFGILSWRSRCADGCLFDKRRALIATWQMQKKKMCRKVQTLCRESYISSAARSKRWVVEDGASSTDSSCFYSSDGWSAHIAGTETESMNNNKK